MNESGSRTRLTSLVLVPEVLIRMIDGAARAVAGLIVERAEPWRGAVAVV